MSCMNIENLKMLKFIGNLKNYYFFNQKKCYQNNRNVNITHFLTIGRLILSF